ALVATNEPLFHEKERRALHDVLVSIREKRPISKLGRARLPNDEWHLKGGDEMASLFPDHPEALARSVEIAEGCTVSLESIRHHYPDEWLPKGFTPIGWLSHLVAEGT